MTARKLNVNIWMAGWLCSTQLAKFPHEMAGVIDGDQRIQLPRHKTRENFGYWKQRRRVRQPTSPWTLITGGTWTWVVNACCTSQYGLAFWNNSLAFAYFRCITMRCLNQAHTSTKRQGSVITITTYGNEEPEFTL
jgi:hypothetical protein